MIVEVATMEAVVFREPEMSCGVSETMGYVSMEWLFRDDEDELGMEAAIPLAGNPEPRTILPPELGSIPSPVSPSVL